MKKGFSLRLFIIAALLSAAFLCPPSKANADETTFNSIFFQPAPGKNSYMMLRDTDVLHNFQFRVGEVFSYSYHPLDMRSGSRRLRGVIDHLIVGDTSIAIGFMEMMQFGIDVPVILFDRFEKPSFGSTLKNEFAIGDIRAELKFSPLDPCKYPVGLSITPFITVPTGKEDYYVGDPGITGGAIVGMDVQMSRLAKATFNVGYKGGKKINFRNIEYQHNLLLGLGASFNVKKITLFGEANMSTAFNKFFSDKETTPIEIDGGVKWDVFDTGIDLEASVGSCAVCGVKGARFRAALGIGYRYNPEKYQKLDRQDEIQCINHFPGRYDLEEIMDLKQRCPADPSMYRAGVDDEACPKFYDLQELADLINTCPPNPADFDPKIHDEACNKVYTLEEYYSAQQIGVVYGLSSAEWTLRCPMDPQDFNPYLHDLSCREFYQIKRGLELQKFCPAKESLYKPQVDDPRCPDYFAIKKRYGETQWDTISKLWRMDTDRDSVNDYLDRCPHVPEDRENFADEDGCPDGGWVAVTGGEIHTAYPIEFEFNSAKLSYNAQQSLDMVVGLVNRSAWIKQIRVAGHADARGTSIANEKISSKRADAVISYMKSHALRENVLLNPIAYGATRPIVPNDTSANRARNRRVVFTATGRPYKGTESIPQKLKSEPQVPAETEEAPAEEEKPAEPKLEKKKPSRWE